MRLRVVELPADQYLLVIDGAEKFMERQESDWFKVIGDAATERSDGACHGVLFFSEEIELP